MTNRSLPPGLLEKVRALLAKAESTTFEAEADAFMAKAQELMTRYRINQAMLAASDGECADVVRRRIGIDSPYADAKAVLVSQVARANGCRAVWSSRGGFSAVFGELDDLEATETIFTSLLVQASAAMRREGSKVDVAGRSRTKRFRRSFLLAFAFRIGQRLRETVDVTVSTMSAETGMALVPMLAHRDAAASLAAESAFPHCELFSPSASDPEGWFKGRLFAETTDLHPSLE